MPAKKKKSIVEEAIEETVNEVVEEIVKPKKAGKSKSVQGSIFKALETERVVVRPENMTVIKCDYVEDNGKQPDNIEMNKSVLIAMALKGLLDKDGNICGCTARINNSLDNETIAFS